MLENIGMQIKIECYEVQLVRFQDESDDLRCLPIHRAVWVSVSNKQPFFTLNMNLVIQHFYTR